MTPRPLLLVLLLGCAASTEPVEAPAPSAPEPVPAPVAEPTRVENPCDKLEPQAFDVTDIDARTDLSDAQKEQAKRERDERRRILFECFQRAMKEKEELEQRSPPAP